MLTGLGGYAEGERIVLLCDGQIKRPFFADFLFIAADKVADVRFAERIASECIAESGDVLGVIHVLINVKFGVNGRTLNVPLILEHDGHARGQGDGRRQVAVVREREISLERADDRTLLHIQNGPQRAGGSQQRTVLGAELMEAGAEEPSWNFTAMP